MLVSNYWPKAARRFRYYVLRHLQTRCCQCIKLDMLCWLSKGVCISVFHVAFKTHLLQDCDSGNGAARAEVCLAFWRKDLESWPLVLLWVQKSWCNPEGLWFFIAIRAEAIQNTGLHFSDLQYWAFSWTKISKGWLYLKNICQWYRLFLS